MDEWDLNTFWEKTMIVTAAYFIGGVCGILIGVFLANGIA